jgi:parvulin-like peptidyl-prolyl isomerase
MAGKEKKHPERETGSSELARRFKANPFLFIGTILLLVIVVVAFVLVPAIVPEAVGSFGADLSFGSYDGVTISYVPGNYFAQMRESYQNIFQYYYGEDLSNMWIQYQIWYYAFNATVVHIGALREMEKVGYVIPDATVDREVAQRSEFQENGRFSSAKYQAMDKVTRIELWEQTRDSLIEERYIADLKDLRLARDEAAFIGAMASPERSFQLAAIPFSSYPDSEVAVYATENATQFTIVHLSKITINSSERDANQILTQIQNGTNSFEEAARTQSQDSYADQGGDMGVKMAYEFETEVPDETQRQTVLGLSPGTVSAVVQGASNSWVIFRSEEAAQSADLSNSENLTKIRAYLNLWNRGRVEDYLIAQAEAFGTSLTVPAAPPVETEGIEGEAVSVFMTAAAGQGFTAQEFGPVPLNYGENDLFTALSTYSIAELSGAASNESFWKAAFGTALNTPSEPFVINNYVLVLYPVAETAAEAASISAIEANYASTWLSTLSEQRIESYFTTSDKLVDRFSAAFSQLYTE